MKRNWDGGFLDGVISVLIQLQYSLEGNSTLYREIVAAHGEEELVERARQTGHMQDSGLAMYLRFNRGLAYSRLSHPVPPSEKRDHG